MYVEIRLASENEEDLYDWLRKHVGEEYQDDTHKGTWCRGPRDGSNKVIYFPSGSEKHIAFLKLSWDIL
jgi:hypothetical protein